MAAEGGGGGRQGEGRGLGVDAGLGGGGDGFFGGVAGEATGEVVVGDPFAEFARLSFTPFAGSDSSFPRTVWTILTLFLSWHAARVSVKCCGEPVAGADLLPKEARSGTAMKREGKLLTSSRYIPRLLAEMVENSCTKGQ